MPASPSPLDDARQLALDLAPIQADSRKKREAPASLGRLAAVCDRIAALRAPRPLLLNRGHVVVFAGAHGVAARGVSTVTPASASAAVQSLSAGGAALNALCAASDLGLKVFELALEVPTADLTEAPALDERAAAATIAFGMEAVAGGTDLLVLGALGAGGETASAAILAALGGGESASFVAEPGLPEHVRRRRLEAGEAALILHRGALADPLAILSRLGGREHAATFGALIAARTEGVAVVLDGHVAVAAALLLHALNPAALGHCLLAHRLSVPAQAELAARAGLEPLLDLGMSSGDGEAGVLAAGLLRAAAAAAGPGGTPRRA